MVGGPVPKICLVLPRAICRAFIFGGAALCSVAIERVLGPVLSLTKISISGFKAVDRFSMSVAPDLTLLVGTNGAGKSSILQALAFAQHLADGNASGFFRDRGWDRKAFKFRSPKHRGTIISISAIFSSPSIGKIGWHVGWGVNTGRLWEEKVQLRRNDGKDPVTIFKFDQKGGGAVGTKDIPSLNFAGSLLGPIQPLDLSEIDREVTVALLDWLRGIHSLELLSPAAMKGGTRVSPGQLGIRGERLAGFLAALNSDQKARIVQRVSQFFPLAEFDTVRKRAGWIDLILTERFNEFGTIRSEHMSDGFMRLLALCSIPELGSDVSMILLDEIEDGIEPHVLNNLITLISRETKAQIIATSHSPLLANVVGVENIRFISRTPEGRSVAADAASMPAFQVGSDFFGPGELWTSTDMRVLQSEAIKQAEHDAAEAETQSL